MITENMKNIIDQTLDIRRIKNGIFGENVLSSPLSNAPHYIPYAPAEGMVDPE